MPIDFLNENFAVGGIKFNKTELVYMGLLPCELALVILMHSHFVQIILEPNFPYV